MSRKLLALLFCAALGTYRADAQGAAPIGPSTQSQTNAASGVTPLAAVPKSASDIVSPDLFTGAANVNIPIYDYSIDGLNLGVSLSYNTTGIKVDQVASLVGLGWNLNFGPVITREVRGIEDELNLKQIDTTSVFGGTAMAVPAMEGAFLANIGSLTTSDCFWDHPDIFSVNLGGREIRFSFQFDNVKGIYISRVDVAKEIRVDVFLDNANLYSLSMSGVIYDGHIWPDVFTTDVRKLRFRITDEHGNQFFFDRGDYQRRKYTYKTFHSLAGVSTHVNWVAMSWVIKRIVTYSGAVIDYEYVNDPVVYPAYMDQRVQESKEYQPCCGPITFPKFFGKMAVINDMVGTEMYLSRPVKITYYNGDIINFIPDSNPRHDISGVGTYAKALKSIVLQKGYDATVKNSFTYKFNYAYYNSDPAFSSEIAFPKPTSYTSTSDHTLNLRLKLKSIDKIGTDNTTTEKYYKFGYIDTWHLPARLSGLTDCYGYSNGAVLSSGGVGDPASVLSTTEANNLAKVNIPWHSFTFEKSAGSFATVTYGRMLDPSFAYAQRGLLNNITNGTGGNIEIKYKQHINISKPPEFNATPSNSQYFNTYAVPADLQYKDANDGVCLSEIVYTDGYQASNSSKSTFSFTNGIRFFVGGYFWIPTFFNDWHGTTGPLDVFQRVYQNSFANPIDYFNGSNHGYSNASVVTSNSATGEVLSKTEYNFTNVQTKYGEEIEGWGDVGAWASSRLQVYPGLFAHTLPRHYFNKEWLGLVKSSAEYSGTGVLLSKVENVWNQIRHIDSPFRQDEAFTYVHNNVGPTQPLYGSGTGREYQQHISYYPHSNIVLKSSTTITYSGITSMSSTKTFNYSSRNDYLEHTYYTDSKGQAVQEDNIYEDATYKIHYYYGASLPVDVDTLTWLAAQRKIVNGYVVNYQALTRVYPGFSMGYDADGNYIPYPSSPAYGSFAYTHCPLGRVLPIYVNSLFTDAPVASAAGNTIIAKHYIGFSDRHNIVETGFNNDQKFEATIWDSRIGEKVVGVANAKYDDIACTSFEGNFAPVSTPDYNRGNWDFESSAIVLGTSSSKAMTGRYYFNLALGTVSSNKIPASGKKYMLSVWYKGPAPFLSGPPATAFTTRYTAGSWNLGTAIVTGDGASTVTITGTALIDELRMHPTDAAMQSCTYEPLLGVSSKCDERNVVTYYEYDAMGRPTVTRDMDGKIISLTKTIVQGSDH